MYTLLIFYNTFSFSRTLTSVYDAILEDLVYPVEIVGKRIRVKLDGSQLIKVHLDKNEQTNIEHKVQSFTLLDLVWSITVSLATNCYTFCYIF